MGEGWNKGGLSFSLRALEGLRVQSFRVGFFWGSAGFNVEIRSLDANMPL